MAKRNLTHKEQAKRHLESLGWEVGDVERVIRNRGKAVSFDLFGFIDLLAIKGTRTLGLQVTDHTHISHRTSKMKQEARLWTCLEAGWEIEAWGVRNYAARDGSFAVVRKFELEKTGHVAVYNDSSIL